jgi:hypothetical protein
MKINMKIAAFIKSVFLALTYHLRKKKAPFRAGFLFEIFDIKPYIPLLLDRKKI